MNFSSLSRKDSDDRGKRDAKWHYTLQDNIAKQRYVSDCNGNLDITYKLLQSRCIYAINKSNIKVI